MMTIPPDPYPDPDPGAVDLRPVDLGDLAAALDLGPHELVSLVGGGGKTTLLFALGRQLGPRTVMTTTTRMGRDQTGGHPVVVAPTDADLIAALDRHRAVLVRGSEDGSKAGGVTPETCDRWFAEVAGVDHVVVEADGSRQRPFKAPRPLEPVIPGRTTLHLACVGAGALGRVIADTCHRPLRVAAVAGCSPYERLTPERLAAVLLSERGSLKGCPPTSRFGVVMNQVADEHLPFVEEVAAIIRAASVINPVGAASTPVPVVAVAVL